MRKFILLIAVLCFGVIGYSNNTIENANEICVDVEMTGGIIDLIQGASQIDVVITENGNNQAMVSVVSSDGETMVEEVFKGDGVVVVDYEQLGSGSYTLVAVAGTRSVVHHFVVQ